MDSQSRRRKWIVAAALGALITSISAGLVTAYSGPHTVGTKTPQSISHGIPVDASAVLLEDAYQVRQAFSGEVQARRISVLGFESAGRLNRVVVEEGDQVEAGDLLAELDTARLQARREELVAAQAEAEARLALADATLHRLTNVIEKGGVSRQGLDEAREGERTARASLRLAEQRITSIDVDLEKSRLLAPFAGTVTGRFSDEGRVLASGESVVQLQEHSAPEIRIGIAGHGLDALAVGQIYRLDWRGQVLKARLRALLPVRNGRTRTVDALFDPIRSPADVLERLLPGDTVTVHLESRIQAPGAWVPLTALAPAGRGLWSLYIVQPDRASDDSPTMHIQRRTVEVLHQADGQVYVRGNLHADDMVVQRGLQRIVPGQRVLIVGAQLGSAS